MYAYPCMTTARPMIPFSVSYTDGPIELIGYRRRRWLCFAFAFATADEMRVEEARAMARASPKRRHARARLMNRMNRIESNESNLNCLSPWTDQDEHIDICNTVCTYTYGWGAARAIGLLANLQSSTAITPYLGTP